MHYYESYETKSEAAKENIFLNQYQVIIISN
jgi:hypothetical protein